MPYTSDPLPSTHPALVGAIARLFGLDAVPLAQARVLELGCAAGGNIIPLAARIAAGVRPDAGGMDGLKVDNSRELCTSVALWQHW